jgi:hypothetical protein
MVVTGQTQQEKAKEQEKRIKELALQTRNWAKHIRAYVHPDTEEHGYFTVDEWMKEFSETRTMWSRVKRQLVKMGEPITFDVSGMEGGHYWGKPGSQMITVTTLAKAMQTLGQTIRDILDAAHESGHWDECLDFMTTTLENSRRDFAIGDISKLINGAGLSLRHDLRQLSLPKDNQVVDGSNPVGDFY